MDFISNPSVRRILVTLAGVAAVSLNKRFALGLEATDILTIGGIVASYILGSNANAAIQGAAKAGQAAAEAATPDAVQKAIADAVKAAQAPK